MKRLFSCLLLTAFCRLSSQTIVMNEVSNGPSGNMEYVEFVVMDTTVTYNCSGITVPPCIDIRGWIFDDNSGYHGSSGVAAGCIRFSNNPFWSCMPVGTIILLYNELDPNSSLPAIDTLMSDGNCRIVVPVNKINWFEGNLTTPGALACSYPALGWTPGGTWNTTLLANGGDCARIVNLAGCEVFSVCWGTANVSNLIYFPGSAQDRVYYFGNSISNDANNQLNWISGCTDPAACGSNTQTPGAPNNPANAAWINGMNNNCTPIPPLIASVSGSTNGSCPCSASASVSASGSLPPYSYTWSPSPGSGQGTPNAGGLCTGTYSCFVQSTITKCTETVVVSVTNGTVGTTASNTGSYCAGSTIQLNTPSATSYTWAGPGGFVSNSQNPTISASSSTMSGTYSVNVTIGNCVTTATTAVTVNALPALSVNSVVICAGQNATLTAGGASTYTWSNGSNTSSVAVNPTITTNYTVVGSNSVCSNTAITTVSVDPLPVITVGSPTICSGETATLTAGGATSYTWNTGPTTSSIIVSPTVTTNYTITGNNGSCTNTQTTSIMVNPPPTVVVNSPSLCSTQVATLTAGGASTYTWSPGNLSGSSVTVSPTSNQNYTVVGTDANGCNDTASATVLVLPLPTISITPSSSFFCAGQAATLTAGGSAGTYSWTDGTSGTINTPSVGGIYTAVVNTSCGTATSSININFVSAPVVTLSSNSPRVCPNGSVTLTANGGAGNYSWDFTSNTDSIQIVNDPGVYSVSVTNNCGSSTASISITPSFIVPDFTFTPNGGVAPVTINFTNTSSNFNSSGWNFGNGSSSALPNPSSEFNLPGIYTVTLMVTNAEGCIGVITKTIEINDAEPVIIIPNVFTPNDDSVNDFFSITISNVKSFSIVIYDRWGIRVFESSQIKVSWDGTIADGRKCSAGTYFFILNFRDLKDKAKVITGSLQLFR